MNWLRTKSKAEYRVIDQGGTIILIPDNGNNDCIRTIWDKLKSDANTNPSAAKTVGALIKAYMAGRAVHGIDRFGRIALFGAPLEIIVQNADIVNVHSGGTLTITFAAGTTQNSVISELSPFKASCTVVGVTIYRDTEKRIFCRTYCADTREISSFL